ncbi:HPP family protein [Talaromyces proteolyticus]|uniref:HPP family protein n=1 Tax=Talaromyces proteolyticus TaxID=1131652 RepID=A0AAD4KZ54_9EURO|nr:HPP family protein [Talaromyces proteolyticus]KAH8702453.1 HPP family protein [Talaromyces proteolyticus]
MGLSDPAAWNFDIDRWLNPIVPPPPWKWLPYPVSYVLGYRKKPMKPVGNLIITAWAFVGIFAGLIVIEVVSKHVAAFQSHQAPIIIASFGAASVLNFYAIESPLAQPRNSVFGQFISSVIGVAICKLFALSPHFESIRWVGGALACALATALMAITKTVHPPAGATALLAVVSNDSLPLGWWLVPVILLGAVLMVIVALIINNIQRKFPQYWWTPEDLAQTKRKEATPENDAQADVESKLTQCSSGRSEGLAEEQVIIRKGSLTVPQHLYLTPEERTFLVELSDRL